MERGESAQVGIFGLRVSDILRIYLHERRECSRVVPTHTWVSLIPLSRLVQLRCAYLSARRLSILRSFSPIILWQLEVGDVLMQSTRSHTRAGIRVQLRLVEFGRHKSVFPGHQQCR